MKIKILIPVLFGILCAACASNTSQKSASSTSDSITSTRTSTHTPATKDGGSATVTITFNHPEKFTDVKDSSMDSDKARDDILERLRDHIVERAASYLAANQTLAITINDVDMAGDFEPWRGPRVQDVRIIKDMYPPRIDLEFTLTGADGKIIASGPRQLRDLNFLMAISPLSNSDSLRHEKALLDNWISSEFRAVKKG